MFEAILYYYRCLLSMFFLRDRVYLGPTHHRNVNAAVTAHRSHRRRRRRAFSLHRRCRRAFVQSKLVRDWRRAYLTACAIFTVVEYFFLLRI